MIDKNSMISLIISVDGSVACMLQRETTQLICYRGCTRETNYQIALCWQEMPVLFFKYFIIPPTYEVCGGYIVFAFPFVCLYVHSFVFPPQVQSFCVKVYKTSYFEDPLMDFIHIWHDGRYTPRETRYRDIGGCEISKVNK